MLYKLVESDRNQIPAWSRQDSYSIVSNEDQVQEQRNTSNATELAFIRV